MKRCYTFGLMLLTVSLLLAPVMGLAEAPQSQEELKKEGVDKQQAPIEVILQYEKKAPPFSVKTRKAGALEMLPCTDCHGDQKPNLQERKLTEEHTAIVLKHGGGQFWCTTCHNQTITDNLTSFKGVPIDFDRSYRLCGQCHFERQKDWFFGGHGKRIGNWNGERQLQLCVECHNPHDPQIQPLKPNPPPKIRHNLERVPVMSRPHPKVWEKYQLVK